MLTLMNTTPDKVATLMVEDYFFNIRQICQRNLTRSEEEAAVRTGQMFMQSIVNGILEGVPKNQQHMIFNRMYQSFVDTLLDYDRKWLWKLFGEFGGLLPETMLN